MAALAYTTTEAVRGALGVTENEISDAMMLDRQLDFELLVDLAGWLITHPSIQFEGTAAEPTAEQTHSWRLLQLYSLWFCTHLMLQNRTAFMQMISDGKNQARRYAEMDWDALTGYAAAQLTKYRNLLAADQGVTLEDAPASIMGRAVPAYNPVTN